MGERRPTQVISDSACILRLDSDPLFSTISIIGGTKAGRIGTFSQYVVVERDQVIESPEHLDDTQAAAWPLGGLTAWRYVRWLPPSKLSQLTCILLTRAAIVNADPKEGGNVLITGIGGGVALLAMQLSLAKKANVYVSSGNEEKIQKAIALGAKGGVNYKNKDWPAQLQKLLERHHGKGAVLSAVVDSGGGEIIGQVSKILKGGGKVVVYGM